jgi:drug/metabolite transporter (DMT)-like permease
MARALGRLRCSGRAAGRYDAPMVSPSARARSSLPATASGTNVHAYSAGDWGLLVAIALIWGSSFLFMEIGLRAFEPGVITLARLSLGVGTLVLISRARRPIDREDWPRVAFLGVIWMAIPLLLFPIAQQWIDSSVTGMINGAMPIFTVAWATYLLRRLPGWRQLVGIGLGFAGIVLVFVPELQAGQDEVFGALIAVLAIVFYGLAANLSVPLTQKYGSLPVVFRAQLVALLVVAPIGIMQIPDSTWSWESASAMLPVGILGTGVAFALMAMLAARVGGPRASIAIYFLPLVAILLGIMVLGEHVAPIALVGVGLVMAGAWTASRRES